MFIPIFIFKKVSVRKVESGDHYTVEWWRQKCGFNSVQGTVARLALLARNNILEKVSIGEYEIVRFMPTASFCENDIVKILQKNT